MTGSFIDLNQLNIFLVQSAILEMKSVIKHWERIVDWLEVG